MSKLSDSLSRTDWERIDAMIEDKIDVSDSPLLPNHFFAKAKLLMPGESASRQTVKVEQRHEEVNFTRRTTSFGRKIGERCLSLVRRTLFSE